MAETAIDVPAITKALREMNAAKNSYSRALGELLAVIPEGVTILHHKPDEVYKPGEKFLCWSYTNSDRGLASGVSEPEGNAVLIQAPGPAEEFLPRLEPAGEFTAIVRQKKAWVKCGDRMPEHGANVFVFAPDAVPEVWPAARGVRQWEVASSWFEDEEVTHWMPLELPAPPVGN